MYGIGEASQFYFQNAIRIIAERMLVSRPNYSKSKKFMYQFNDQGCWKILL
jgi:hypothetical protein